jgi:hypothetical protein
VRELAREYGVIRAEHVIWISVKMDRFRGFRDMVYEPDGNVPPDFLVDGKIAIEVRRLNQHHQNECGQLEALEALAIPRDIKVRTLLDSFGAPSQGGASWYAYYKYQRPQLIKDWETVLSDKLNAFLAAAVQEPYTEIRVDKHFSLRLTRRQQPGQQIFLLAGHSDYDSGGWVIPELEKNINLCVEEKTHKIAPHRTKYPEWWLVLVDFIIGGIQEPVQISHGWDRVIIIHPSNYAGAYEV